MNISLLLVLLAFLLCVREGHSITCYHCTSVDEGCSDPVDKAALVSYESINTCTSCLKTASRGTADKTINRSCVTVSTNLLMDCSASSSELHICYCDSELCNGGSYPSRTLLSLILPTMLTAIMHVCRREI